MFHSRQRQINSRQEQGFTLVMMLALGLIMTLLGTGLIIRAQRDSAIASARKDTGAGISITEGSVARTLALLKQPQNAALLTRNYDPINPRTNKNYLGADGAPNSGDEGTTAIDEWAGYNPSTNPCYQQAGIGAPNLPLTGTVGAGTYTVRAYRYNPAMQLGSLLMEGRTGNQSSAITVSFTVNPFLDNFPGIAASNPTVDPAWPAGAVAIRGRQVLGMKGNIYYNPVASADPALAGKSAPGDATRPGYLNAIWSSNTQDGATGDTVLGKIFGCDIQPLIPDGIRGTNVGVINTSQTLNGVGGSVPTLYQVNQIDLANSDVLTVDTTSGPVRIDIVEPPSPTVAITLRNNAKILNIRTDGKPPRVGDLRILARGDSKVVLYDQTCIQNAFLWLFVDELQLLTSGAGCPSGRNTNFEGVVWAEAVLTAKNAATNRDVNYLGMFGTGTPPDTTVIPGATSGIYVPDDVSSLIDLLTYTTWPIQYQLGEIKSWSRQRL